LVATNISEHLVNNVFHLIPFLWIKGYLLLDQFIGTILLSNPKVFPGRLILNSDDGGSFRKDRFSGG
jgi:hypothetical protein